MGNFDITATIKAVDDASSTLQNVGSTAENSFEQATKASETTSVSFADLTIKMSGLATSGFALYDMYDRVDNAQFRADRAAVSLQGAKNAEADAWEKARQVMAKYGEDSEEYASARRDAEQATDRARIAEDQLAEKQKQVNEAMMHAAIEVMPATITLFDNLGSVTGLLGGTFTSVMPKVASAATGAFSLIAAHPIVLVIMAIVAAAVLLYEAWQTNFGGIRDFSEDVFNRLQGGFNTLLDIGGRVIDFFKGLGAVIGEVLKGQMNAAIWLLNKAIDGVNLLIAAYNSTVGLVPGVKRLDELAHIPALGEGGIVTEPTLALIGESGPEAVVPLNGNTTSGIHITGPLIVVQGSVDKETAEFAVKRMFEELRSVVFENTSSGASATKMIRKR
ncbi:MAG: hypothetical protein M1503_10135 [Thaumarchaeota archaeon]|nr:hypothetical protein [Nitrososphaerota archaeon]MCL5318600.1 hypothetical protein [Nitrososphaerota archaeon]